MTLAAPIEIGTPTAQLSGLAGAGAPAERSASPAGASILQAAFKIPSFRMEWQSLLDSLAPGDHETGPANSSAAAPQSSVGSQSANPFGQTLFGAKNPAPVAAIVASAGLQPRSGAPQPRKGPVTELVAPPNEQTIATRAQSQHASPAPRSPEPLTKPAVSAPASPSPTAPTEVSLQTATMAAAMNAPAVPPAAPQASTAKAASTSDSLAGEVRASASGQRPGEEQQPAPPGTLPAVHSASIQATTSAAADHPVPHADTPPVAHLPALETTGKTRVNPAGPAADSLQTTPAAGRSAAQPEALIHARAEAPPAATSSGNGNPRATAINPGAPPDDLAPEIAPVSSSSDSAQSRLAPGPASADPKAEKARSSTQPAAAVQAAVSAPAVASAAETNLAAIAPYHAAALNPVPRASDAAQMASPPPGGERDTFSALDSASPAPTWIHTGARHAEAGYLDPSLGWVGVRAETQGATLHAAIVPGSPEAAQTLGSHLAGLNAYLAEHHGQAATLTLASPQEGEHAATGQQTSNQDHQQPHNDAPPDSAPPPATAATAVRNSFEESQLAAAIPPAQHSTGGHISVMA